MLGIRILAASIILALVRGAAAQEAPANPTCAPARSAVTSTESIDSEDIYREAVIRLKQGDLDAAISGLTEALQLLREARGQTRVDVLEALAIAHDDKGRLSDQPGSGDFHLDAASACLEAAAKIAGPDARRQVSLLRRLADIHWRRGREGDSLAASKAAYRIGGDPQDGTNVAILLGLLAQRSYANGSLGGFDENLQAAARIYEVDLKQFDKAAELHGRIGRAYYDDSDARKASEAYQRQVRLYEDRNVGTRRDRARAYWGLAASYLLCEICPDSEQMALKYYRRANDLANSDDIDDRVAIAQGLSDAAEKSKEFDQAFDAAFAGLSISVKETALSVRSALADSLRRVSPMAQRPKLYWNLWLTDTNKAVAQSMKAGEYRIRLDLSSIKYGDQSAQRETREAHADALRNAVAILDPRAEREARVEVLLVPDGDGQIDQRQTSKQMSIDFTRLRSLAASATPLGEPQIATIKSPSEDSAVVLGHVEYTVRLLHTVTELSWRLLVITQDSRLIASQTVTLCSNPSCSPFQNLEASPATLNQISSPVRVPTVTLRLLKWRPSGRQQRLDVMLLRHSDDVRLDWSLPADTNLERRTAVFIKQFAAADEVGRRETGRQLFEFLVPAGTRQRFAQMLEPHLRAKAPPAPANAPSLYVQIIEEGFIRSLVIPAGMMYVPPADQAYDSRPLTEDRGAFIGFRFRTEIAMAAGGDTMGAPCISRWRLVAPDKAKPAVGNIAQKSAMELAMDAMAPVLQQWRDNALPFPPVSNPADLNSSMGLFSNWLRSRIPTSGLEALLVVSHQGQGEQLYFDERDRYKVTPESIGRTFGVPYLGIFNMCGKGEATMGELLRRLSERGMRAIIAPATDVNGTMAGHFVTCLTKQLKAPESSSVPSLSEAYFGALTCVRDTRVKSEYEKPTWDAAVLTYILFGSGSASVCQPVGLKK